MEGIWLAIAESMAALMNTSTESAGWVLGFMTIAAFMLAFIIALAAAKVRISGVVMLVPTIISIAFVGLTEWWPNWAIFLVVLVTAAVIGWEIKTGGTPS